MPFDMYTTFSPYFASDAYDAAANFNDAGVTQAAINDLIYRILNKGSGAGNLDQATSGNRATLVNLATQRRAWRFDGANRGYRITFSNSNQPGGVGVVFRPNQIATGFRVVMSGSAGHDRAIVQTASNLYLYAGTSSAQQNILNATDTFILFAYFNGSSSVIRWTTLAAFNAGLSPNVVSGLNCGSQNFGGLNLGCGGTGLSDAPFIGDIEQLYVINAAISTGDQADALTWMANLVNAKTFVAPTILGGTVNSAGDIVTANLSVPCVYASPSVGDWNVDVNGTPSTINTVALPAPARLTFNMSTPILAGDSVDLDYVGTPSVVGTNGLALANASTIPIVNKSAQDAPSAPIVLVHPRSIPTAVLGETVRLTACFFGTPEPTFQWESNDGTGWTTMTGEVSDQLSVVVTITETEYRCTATNSQGSVTSNSGVL